jgi:hypothetical protein
MKGGRAHPRAHGRTNSGLRGDRRHRLFSSTPGSPCLRQICRPAARARPPPGFIIATIVNFALNRAITFRNSRAPVLRAFPRYCGVASVGFAINYAVYSTCVISAPRLGVAVTPAILPLFIAAGSGVAMVLTFVGFRFFAFGH